MDPAKYRAFYYWPTDKFLHIAGALKRFAPSLRFLFFVLLPTSLHRFVDEYFLVYFCYNAI